MSSEDSGTGRAVAELIDRLGRHAHGAGFSAGLNPAQWTALRYFARANRLSCTVSAFAEYHGTTRGTASQTVKALVDKGYLVRSPVAVDQRSFRLSLTDKGRGSVGEDPIRVLEEATASLSPDERASVAACLDVMLGCLRGAGGSRRFGACRQCRHLCRGESAESRRCGMFRHAVGDEELEKICFNFDLPEGSEGETANVN